MKWIFKEMYLKQIDFEKKTIMDIKDMYFKEKTIIEFRQKKL